ncbi:MAG: sulfatase-like hydrolase/transferase [Euzebyales bacterium]|nr:sulfatase-like hydrolase/transferase [Euzebyales bacterium]
MRRLPPLHPLLFAAWPVLFLYAHNVDETPLSEGLGLLGTVLGITASLYAVLALLLRDIRRAAVMTTVLALAVLLYGHARNLVGDITWLPLAWMAVAAALLAGAARLRAGADEVTTILSGVAAVLVALAGFNLSQAAGPAFAATAGDGGDPALAGAVGSWSQDGQPRDIYYLIFDRYGSEKGLRERFGFDNSPFVKALESRGFFVAGNATANHLKTAQSLASSLNLRYLDGLAERYGPDTGNLLPTYEMLQDHAVGRILRERGYTYVHIGAWWDPTQSNRQADVNLGYERRSDFFLAFWETTLLSEMGQRPSQRSGEQRRRTTYHGALTQFEQLAAVAQRPEPTFTFGHVLLPHQPFVFDRQGRYKDLERDARDGHDRGYLEQLSFTNGKILTLLDRLLDVPEAQRPIIVVQADEGPHPLSFLRTPDPEKQYSWAQASDAEVAEKLRILNAYYLPGVEDPGLYDTISPVNTWRLLFDIYFGAELPLLADRSYIFRDGRHVYDFIEVTRRVR